MLGHFIDHRHNVVVRRSRFDLAAAREREHILEGAAARGRQHRRGRDYHPRIAGCGRSGGGAAPRIEVVAQAGAPGRAGRGSARGGRRRAVRAVGAAGAGHPGHAAGPADRARDGETRRRVAGRPGTHRRAGTHSRRPRRADGHHQGRTEGRGRPLRRRPPFGNPGQRVLLRRGGPDRGRGGRDHHVPPGLRETDPHRHLPCAAARRTRPPRDEHQGGGLGRASLRGVDPRLPDGLHRPGPGATG